jgi:DNA-binding CsgD family transcriptional regulator
MGREAIGLTASSPSPAGRLARVQAALVVLREVSTVADLVVLAPRQVGTLGFDRCLISRFDDTFWIARAAYVRDDVAAQAHAAVAAGSVGPRLVDHRIVESELVRCRKPLLITDPRDNDRVHPELNRLVRPAAYVAAPIVVGSKVAGFLHADIRPGGRLVDELDREVLMVFATGLGILIERVHYLRRLGLVHEQVAALAATDPDLGDESEPAASRPGVGPPRASGLARAGRVGGLAALTRREYEVLTVLAAGETNRRIAAQLYICESTVKAHVKHILRKLGAANRADAVSRYLRG